MLSLSGVEIIMPVRTVAPVNVQPHVTLECWRVRETRLGQRHFVGYCVENHEGRVSSAIQSFDTVTGGGVTSSGRRYLLAGWPCFDGDAERIWERLVEQYDIGETKDVSKEFMAPRSL
ncbi:hypothetical protein BJN34_21425 [Cupriavidus necator]|uniref:Uncharacterized protein n=1 Tax=Cupriavidus necator TaxID=106590 RepID=A0A1U9UUT5_CUPNE|nr:hypothetical protein BJN34_21425 [Cupriavidus necator]